MINSPVTPLHNFLYLNDNLLHFCIMLSTQGIGFAVLEVFTISTFVFLVLSYLPPNVSILILSGVFPVQIFIDIYYNRVPWKPSPATRQHYQNLDMMATPIGPSKLALRLAVLKEYFRMLLENKVVKYIALVLQVGGILGLAIDLRVRSKAHMNGTALSMESNRIALSNANILHPIIAFPIALLIMSFIWSDKVQKLIAHTKRKVGKSRTARYKSSKFVIIIIIADIGNLLLLSPTVPPNRLHQFWYSSAPLSLRVVHSVPVLYFTQHRPLVH